MRGTRSGLFLILAALIAGCGVHVPPKYQVTDVSSGKTFTTYGTWGKENMLGYNFYDIDSGERIMLKSYQSKKISNGGFFPQGSPEAEEYNENARRLADLGN